MVNIFPNLMEIIAQMYRKCFSIFSNSMLMLHCNFLSLPFSLYLVDQSIDKFLYETCLNLFLNKMPMMTKPAEMN